MKDPVEIEIDAARCNGCGACLEVCQDGVLALAAGRARVIGERCTHCGHCAAICLPAAIRIGRHDPAALTLKGIENRDGWLRPGESDLAAIAHLMKSRRSCRHYLKDPVPLEHLEDLVRLGTLAPSGTNCQRWTFTLVPDRAAVERLGDGVASFYRGVNRMARSPLKRAIAKIFLHDALGIYYREYYPSIEEALRGWDQARIDRLFHGAPALIVIGMRPGASTPGEDALLAAQNILLAAHAMGYGTCLIGFAVEAMRRAPALKTLIGIPAAERVHAIITVGKPRLAFHRAAGRKPALVRIFSSEEP